MLFAVLASEAMPPNLAELRQLAYLEAVADFPAWAVQEAVRMWRDGLMLAEGENRNFVPKPAELMRLVRLVMEPAIRERDSTQRLLEAIDAAKAEPTPEERAAVAKGFDALRGEMRPERTAHQVSEDAMSGLERRATANGIDFQTAFDSIPDAKPPASSFRKAKLPDFPN
jgi:hypothetical protein